MSKCLSCLHYEVCDYRINEEDITVAECTQFTDRSEWVHLPCKVGDKVYYTYQSPTTCEYSIHKIYLIEFKDNHFYFYAIPSLYFKDTEFGKSVFLTREEAEKSIKGN